MCHNLQHAGSNVAALLHYTTSISEDITIQIYVYTSTFVPLQWKVPSRPDPPPPPATQLSHLPLIHTLLKVDPKPPDALHLTFISVQTALVSAMTTNVLAKYLYTHQRVLSMKEASVHL